MDSMNHSSTDQIRWNSDLANDLKLRVQATKLTPRKLMEGRDSVPHGLDSELFYDLLGSYHGLVEKSLIEYLYKLCQDEAKADQYIRSKKKAYVNIPQEKRKQILSERARTGVFVRSLLKSAGVTHIDCMTIMKLANNRQKKGSMEEMDKVLELYAERQTRSAVSRVDYQVLSQNYDFIDEESKIKLRRLRDIGLLPGFILSLGKDCPRHLSASIISSWINKENRKAGPKDVEWVLDSCREILEETLALYEE